MDNDLGGNSIFICKKCGHIHYASSGSLEEKCPNDFSSMEKIDYNLHEYIYWSTPHYYIDGIYGQEERNPNQAEAEALAFNNWFFDNYILPFGEFDPSTPEGASRLYDLGRISEEEYNQRAGYKYARMARESQRIEEAKNVPKCPTCGSTKVHRITALNRGASVAMWGLFSGKIGKNYECENCKARW